MTSLGRADFEPTRPPRLDLVIWDRGDKAAAHRPVGFVDPFTGELVDAADPANVAGWYLAYRDFVETVARPAEAAALALLNAHLDYQGAAKTQIELAGGRVVEISGETASAAASAVAVESAEALRDDLDVLVERGDLAPQAADDAVRVETVTTFKADLRKVKALAARGDVVGETVRDHLTGAPRERKRPTVKRIA